MKLPPVVSGEMGPGWVRVRVIVWEAMEVKVRGGVVRACVCVCDEGEDGGFI